VAQPLFFCAEFALLVQALVARWHQAGSNSTKIDRLGRVGYCIETGPLPISFPLRTNGCGVAALPEIPLAQRVIGVHSGAAGNYWLISQAIMAGLAGNDCCSG
jgi:hypothetical protein